MIKVSPDRYFPHERFLKAIANRRRLGILVYLKRYKEGTVGDIARAIHLSIKSTSKHLSILKNAQILEVRQQKLYMHYSLQVKQNRFTKTLLSIL